MVSPKQAGTRNPRGWIRIRKSCGKIVGTGTIIQNKYITGILLGNNPVM